MVTLFYIKKEEDSLYFRYFIKIVDGDMCIIGLLWIELRKLKPLCIDLRGLLCYYNYKITKQM